MSDTNHPVAAVLRVGTPSDTLACVSLWAASCAHRDGHAVLGVAERAQTKFDKEEAWIVAEQVGAGIVGFALATPPGSGMPTDPSDAVVLGLLAVDPGKQGNGLGRQLLCAITSALIDKGFEQAVLHSLIDNRSAVQLYEAAGWCPHGAMFEHTLLKRPMQTYRRDLRHQQSP